MGLCLRLFIYSDQFLGYLKTLLQLNEMWGGTEVVMISFSAYDDTALNRLLKAVSLTV